MIDRSEFRGSQLEARAEAELAELAGPPGLRQSRQREIHLRESHQQIQRCKQRSRAPPLHDDLAALGRRLREVLCQRPRVALDRGLEVDT